MSWPMDSSTTSWVAMPWFLASAGESAAQPSQHTLLTGSGSSCSQALFSWLPSPMLRAALHTRVRPLGVIPAGASITGIMRLAGMGWRGTSTKPVESAAFQKEVPLAALRAAPCTALLHTCCTKACQGWMPRSAAFHSCLRLTTLTGALAGTVVRAVRSSAGAASPRAATAKADRLSSAARLSHSGWITGCCSSTRPAALEASPQLSRSCRPGAWRCARRVVSSRVGLSDTSSGMLARAAAAPGRS